MHTLLHAASSLSRVLKVDLVMRHLVKAATELTDAEGGTAGLMVDGRMVFTEYQRNGELQPIDFTFPPGYGVPGHIIDTRKPYISNDAAHDKHVVPEIQKTLGFGNLINVPILTRTGQLLGCFEIHNTRDGRPFDKEDLRVLTGLAHLAAAALSNALLLEQRNETEEKLRRANRALRAISACNKDLVRATDQHTWLEQICQTIVRVGGYRLAWVGFAEHDRRKTVRPVAQAGYEQHYLQSVDVVWSDTPRGRGPVGTAIRTGQPCMIRNVQTDPHFAVWRKDAIDRGYASVLGLPLVSGEETLGALVVYSDKPDAFDADELALLTQLADDLTYGLVALRTRDRQRQAEQAALESRERLKEAQRIGSIGNWEHDLLSGQITWSDQVFRLFQRDPAQGTPTYRGILKYYVPASARRLDERTQYALKHCQRVEFDLQAMLPDGTAAHHSVIIRPVPDKTGRVVTLQGTVQDITDRKRAEEEIASLARFVQESPNPVLRMARNGTLLYANATAEPLLRAWGCGVGDILPKDIRRPGLLALRRGHNVNIDTDCAGRTFLMTFAPVADSGYVNAYARDITDRRRAEDQVKAVNLTLEQRVAERTALAEQRATQLRALAAQVTRAEQQERRRVANILHEHLQQLLVASKFNISRLGEAQKDKETQLTVHQALAAIEQALQVSRSLTVELRPPVLYELGLAAALRWLAQDMKNKHGLTVHVQADPKAEPTYDDARILLFEAVRELLFNVVKHAHVKTAKVKMALLPGDLVQVVVTDQGVGFDPLAPRDIGQTPMPFGLFSIRERMSILGGNLDVRSTPGKGSRLTLTAPMHQR